MQTPLETHNTCSRRYARGVYPVTAALSEEYGDFAHNNKRNPLAEALFIICSIQTDERGYHSTYRSLRREYLSFQSLAEASETEIARIIYEGGLSNQKAKAIKRLLQAVCQSFGKPSLSSLKAVADRECEQTLISLPGIGKKTARCIMMYCFGRQVFPVDTHCWRISRRLGWVRATRKDAYCSQRDMDRLQAKIPPELRFSLHVNMVSHGRAVCTAHKPACDGCPILRYCRRAGLRHVKLRET